MSLADELAQLHQKRSPAFKKTRVARLLCIFCGNLISKDPDVVARWRRKRGVFCSTECFERDRAARAQV